MKPEISKPTKTKAFPRVASAIILMLAIIGGIFFIKITQKPAPVLSSLSISPQMAHDQSYSLGNFRIHWDGKQKQLTITNQDFKNHVVFATPKNKGFLAAGRGVMTSTEHRGHFKIDEKRQWTCDHQTVSDMVKKPGKVIIIGAAGCSNRNVPYEFILSPTSAHSLQYQVYFHDSAINRTYFSWATHQDEHFFGFGEQYSSFDMKGKRLPILVEEQGIGRGLQPFTWGVDLTKDGAGGSWWNSYAPVPQFISSDMRSLYSENKVYQVFDFTNPRIAQLEVFSPDIKGLIYAGDTPKQLVKEHTAVVGRMQPLPKWTQQGLILGVQGGTEAVKAKLQKLLDAGVPVAGLWIQDWVGQRKTSFGKQLWWNWELDHHHYDHWDAFTNWLAKKHIKLLGYINPFLVDVSAKAHVEHNYYQIAKDKGYLVKDPNGNPLSFQITSFSAGLVDLTNPEAREWFKQIMINNLVDNGFSGWMADFGESLPFNAQLANGETGFTYHNQYPVEWAKLNREVMKESGLGKKGLFFVRAGYSNSPKYASSFWLGDQLVTWGHHDGIKTAVTGLLSSGLSGFSINHSDIGGYTTIDHFPFTYKRSKELLERWIELNAITSLFRSHEGNLPDENFQVYSDPDVIKETAKFATLYKKLAPYRMNLMKEAAKTGAPIVRSLFFNYPKDPHTYKLGYQEFMLGRDLLVAPVLDKGKDQVHVYLPKGEWIHLWSGEKYSVKASGESMGIHAPIGKPAVFVRVNSLPEKLLLK